MKLQTQLDLTPLRKSEDEIETKREQLKKANLSFTEKWRNSDEYLNNPEAMKEALDDYEDLVKNFEFSGDVGYYMELRNYLDESDPEIKAKLNKIEELKKNLQNEASFFTLKISKIPEETQKKFLNSEELKDYKYFLERKFQLSKHLLSEAEEKILNLKEQTSHSFWERMTSSLITQQEKEIFIEDKKAKKNFSELLKLLDDENEETRKNSAEALNEIFSQYSEIAEPEINAI